MLDHKTLLTHADRLPIQSFEWGTLQWLCNGELLAGTTQTVGICRLHPGKRNPVHFHPNCEEILCVQQGRGKHLLDEQMVSVQAGSVVRIPLGMRHQLINEGTETMITIIVFSCADRQTVFLE